jgi:UDP-N-acetylglucosamine:LPS N-acetylglucosamine transferase
VIDGARVALVCSSGGHLSQLLVLEPWWSRQDRFWVTFDKPDARHALEGERAFWCHQPTNRNIPNLLRNLVLAFRILRRERPRLIVSTGAGPAVPFFWAGKLLGARTIFVEIIDPIERPSLTGRLLRPVADRYLVQSPAQVGHAPSAELIGPLV